MAEEAPTRLKVLLQERLWHSYSTFCAEYNRVAKSLDGVPPDSYPSRAQFHRWQSGTVKKLPYPHHRRVLEAMFPDWSLEQLFQTDDQDQSISPAERQPLPKREIGRLLDLVDAGLKAPDQPLPGWGPPGLPPTAASVPRLRQSPISAYGAPDLDGLTRQLGTELVELSRLMRLTDTETRQLAGLTGHVVELELSLSIDIARDGSARVLYQHDLVNLNEKPLGRVTREVWFQYVDTSINITPTQHNDRRIVIQRIHDAGSLAKFAFKISPPLKPGERTTVRYVCEGGSFRDALYWREFMTRYTRHYTFRLRQQGVGKLTDCTAVIEHSDGSETSVTEGLLWDYHSDDVTVTAAVDYLRPGQTVELRWDADRAATR
jgi:hypothetical protein